MTSKLLFNSTVMYIMSEEIEEYNILYLILHGLQITLVIETYNILSSCVEIT